MKHYKNAITKNRKIVAKDNNMEGHQLATTEDAVRFLSIVQPVLDGEINDEARRMRQEEMTQTISEYRKVLAERTTNHVGHPCCHGRDFQGLEILIHHRLDSLGDPFVEGDYETITRPFEIGVVEWFAQLWELERDELSGYVTNGGTEGNLHGLYVGSENFPDGIMYASSESHYSIFKAAHMYRMPLEKIATLPSGEINYDYFKEALLKNQNRPAVVNVNVGTTVKGAVDDIDRIIAILKETGYPEDRFYIHCDGALVGLMIPFLDNIGKSFLTFKKPIGSISVSGHKLMGSRVPCGVVLTRKKYLKALVERNEYGDRRPDVMIGSRNGHAALFLWYGLSTKGYFGLKQDVDHCYKYARLLKDILDLAEIPAMRNELSNTVIFERPRNPLLIRKWQLACMGDKAHMILLPYLTTEKLEPFVVDLLKCFSKPMQEDILDFLNAAKEEEKNREVIVESPDQKTKKGILNRFTCCFDPASQTTL